MSQEDFKLDSIPQIAGEPADGKPVEKTAASPFTNFCLKEKLREVNGKIYGNWKPSFGGACLSDFDNYYIEKASVISKEEVGRCSQTGKMVVKYVHH